MGSGSRGESALRLAQRVLAEAGDSLDKLAHYTLEDLCQFKGIGLAKAITLLAALELGRRKRATGARKETVITSSRQVFELMTPALSDLSHEEFWFLLLSQRNGVLSREQLSRGGLSQTTVDVRLLLRKALARAASGIILCHNHPSGSLKPSPLDVNLTQKVKEAAKLMDIAVLDHVIFCQKTYFSFADNGML